MFIEYANSFSGEITPLKIYPKATDRSAYESLPRKVADAILKEADRYLHFHFPALLATQFLEFTRNGNRTNYEDILFSKRKALSALVLGECVSYHGKYLDDIINGIFSICEESAWFLPAHNSYIRDTPQLPLPDATHPVLELFSCETGAILATTLYLLGDALDAFSPTIRLRIQKELQERIYTPYLKEHFWWMGRGMEPMCNWTIWCTQNVLLSILPLLSDHHAFTTSFGKKELSTVLKKACESIDYFLKDYGEDGCCEEGAQYYRHAGLCLFQTLEILSHCTGGHFAPLWKEEKVRNIALYILHVHVQDGIYLNFADCAPLAGRCGAREFLYGMRTESPSLMALAAKDVQDTGHVIHTEEHNLYYRLQEAFTWSALQNYPVPQEIFHPMIYYPSVGLWVARNERMVLGVKAGNNGDSHNHNDTGSLTLYLKDHSLLSDLGVESYTKKTFSPNRYEIWTMQSDYHNLPTLQGRMQKDGKEYGCSVLSKEFTTDGGCIQLELASAYPSDALVTSYQRKVALNQQGLALTDTWNLAPRKAMDSTQDPTPDATMDATVNTTDTYPVILNFITYEIPKILPESQGLTINLGDAATLQISETTKPEKILLEELPITDPRLSLSWKHSLYRIRLCYKNLQGKASLTIS